MDLMVTATERVAESIPPEERGVTPLFTACPSGPDMALPFLDALADFTETLDSPRLPGRVFGDGAGNVIEYLKHSVGNSPGHIAKHAGFRGANACFTGFGSSFHALRKAILLIRAGAVDRAVVAAGEAPAVGAGDVAELGAAIVLGAAPSTGLHVRLSLAAVQTRATAPGSVTCFESCNAVASLLCTLIEPPAAGEHRVIGERNRWGHWLGFVANG
jgi:hypothetical protein